MLSGEYYDPSDAELVKLRLEARLLTEKLNQTSVSCPEKRVEIIKSLLGSTG
ncbi:maltose acetyltransferase domain-containing protein, partial [Vibrio cholerae]